VLPDRVALMAVPPGCVVLQECKVIVVRLDQVGSPGRVGRKVLVSVVLRVFVV
jgi:hypothetical protein